MTALAEQILQTILRIILKKTVCELLLLSDIDSPFLTSPVGVGEYTAVITLASAGHTQLYSRVRSLGTYIILVANNFFIWSVINLIHSFWIKCGIIDLSVYWLI